MARETASLPTPDLERLVQVRLDQFREVPGLLEWQLPIGAAWLQLTAEGRPSTVEEIAAVLGWSAEEVTARLQEWGIEPDNQGRLDVAESAPGGVPLPVYKVRWLDTGQVGDVPGCAGDALSPVLSAGRAARIELSCPATGRPISVQVGAAGEFEGVEPAAAVAIIQSLDSDWHPRDWDRSDCANGLFFASAEAASGWLADHPGFIAVPMEFFVRSEALFFDRALGEALGRPT